MSQAKELLNKKILREIKKIILKAAVTQMLQSNNIDVSLLTEAVRDRI